MPRKTMHTTLQEAPHAAAAMAHTQLHAHMFRHARTDSPTQVARELSVLPEAEEPGHAEVPLAQAMQWLLPHCTRLMSMRLSI